MLKIGGARRNVKRNNRYYGSFCFLNLVYLNLFKVVRRVVKIMSGFGLSINGQHVYCGDFIFSGHTMILILAYLIITECNYTQILFTQSLKLRVFLFTTHFAITTLVVDYCAGNFWIKINRKKTWFISKNSLFLFWKSVYFLVKNKQIFRINGISFKSYQHSLNRVVLTNPATPFAPPPECARVHSGHYLPTHNHLQTKSDFYLYLFI